MSLLPFILDELQDLSAAFEDAPRRPLRHRYVDDPLEDLLSYRRPNMLRLTDSDGPVTLVLRPHHGRRQELGPIRHARQAALAKQRAEAHKDHAFHVSVDVQQFRPDELSVQVLKDQGCVVVEGQHEERPDEHGYVRRQFTRRYKLPVGVDPDTVTSKLTSDGVLQVSAPRPAALEAPKDSVKNIPITHSERPAVEHAGAGEAAAGEHVPEQHQNGQEKMEA